MKRTTSLKILLIPLLLILMFSLIGCVEEKKSFTGDEEADQRLLPLLKLLDTQTDEQQRYGIMEQIISILRSKNMSEELKLFVNDYLSRYPEDTYNGYYLLILATLYDEEGAHDIAAIYYNRLIKSYEDLMIKGQSVHYYSLNKLLADTSSNLKKIEYYRELINRFSSEVDKGLIYYNLAKACEAEGLWEDSIGYYRKFLDAPPTVIPGLPNVYNETAHYINFHYSGKDWTRETLEGLVNSVKYAIRTRNGSRLKRYMSEDFFMMSWGQDRYDPFTEIPMDLSYFLKSSVWYNRNLETDSNNSEAFLKTGGWSYRIKTWYLYFNRVHYPVDPEINGRWEWAGIYFGDQL